MKILISKSFHGFKLSLAGIREAIQLGIPDVKELTTEMLNMCDESYSFMTAEARKDMLVKHPDMVLTYFAGEKLDRTNPELIAMIERMGSEAMIKPQALKIVDVPDDVEWEISCYDGVEKIEEKHRVWS